MYLNKEVTVMLSTTLLPISCLWDIMLAKNADSISTDGGHNKQAAILHFLIFRWSKIILLWFEFHYFIVFHEDQLMTCQHWCAGKMGC